MRTDIDLSRSRFKDGGDPSLSWADDELRTLYQKQGWFSGEQIQQHYRNGRSILEEFADARVTARLQGHDNSLCSALKSLLGFHNPELWLWNPPKDSQVCERYSALMTSIESQDLRDHIGGFFQSEDDAQDGAVFIDAIAHKARRDLMQSQLKELGLPALDHVLIDRTIVPLFQSWETCPCDGSEPYGTYYLHTLLDSDP